ncbi:MAG: hypothetical protein CVU55_16240 [Deltaproteobacteria bacterium HGW-Deltaproteobacteria-13]|jgi:hypothetical protein|nr:MAG: hypothetical protein CVU55_16240 [Deltaproteobacteria bacterium HGW-Deltaproteobacteria-13]
MLKAGTILAGLYERLEPEAKSRKITDLRIGLGYVGVRLDHDAAGIAAVLFDALPHGCTVMPNAGNFAGSPAANLLKYLVNGENPLEIAMGLACANAMIQPSPSAVDDREATTYLDLQQGVKVAMVGLFSPLVARIRASGAELTIIEKNPARMEILSDKDKKEALKSCHVAIITATTLLNSTFEETISLLGKPRAVAILGPSTPLIPELFLNTPVTHLGGATVADSARVLQIISEGGGTPALRPYLRFVNLLKNN